MAQVAAEVCILPPAWCSGLRIHHCCSYGVGLGCSSDPVSDLGTSMWWGMAKKTLCLLMYINIWPIFNSFRYVLLSPIVFSSTTYSPCPSALHYAFDLNYMGSGPSLQGFKPHPSAKAQIISRDGAASGSLSSIHGLTYGCLPAIPLNHWQ